MKREGEKKGKDEEKAVAASGPVPEVEVEVGKQAEGKKDEDIVMGDDDKEEVISWQEYDFTKPTGCDHASCGGCKTDGIWSGSWVTI